VDLKENLKINGNILKITQNIEKYFKKIREVTGYIVKK